MFYDMWNYSTIVSLDKDSIVILCIYVPKFVGVIIFSKNVQNHL